MHHSERIKFYQRMQQNGEKTPLDDMPTLTHDESWFLEAFHRLSKCSQVGMDYGPLVLSEIISYWEYVGNICPLDEFIDMIQALDYAFLSHRAEQRKQEAPQQNQIRH